MYIAYSILLMPILPLRGCYLLFEVGPIYCLSIYSILLLLISSPADVDGAALALTLTNGFIPQLQVILNCCDAIEDTGQPPHKNWCPTTHRAMRVRTQTQMPMPFSQVTLAFSFTLFSLPHALYCASPSLVWSVG